MRGVIVTACGWLGAPACVALLLLCQAHWYTLYPAAEDITLADHNTPPEDYGPARNYSWDPQSGPRHCGPLKELSGVWLWVVGWCCSLPPAPCPLPPAACRLPAGSPLPSPPPPPEIDVSKPASGRGAAHRSDTPIVLVALGRAFADVWCAFHTLILLAGRS
jgi:hypothetical protein